MRYSLLVYTRPGSLDDFGDEERRALFDEYAAVDALPAVVGSGRLEPVETATTVRVDGERTLVTDGPFADTKEVFAGFFVLDAADLDEAISVARRLPAARLGGAIEVRPMPAR
jgi:hypothetical protein